MLPRHRAQAAAFRAQAAGRGAVHELRVSALTPLTDDAVVVTFAVPEELRPVYRFQPGQHLVLIADVEGEELRRSYSICVPGGAPELAVAVRRVDGGRFSTWATRSLRPGDRVRVMAPAGRFTPRLNPAHAKRYVAVAAGSGITPILSIVASILASEPGSRVTLLYGNRAPASTMFLAELHALRDHSAGRLRLHLQFSRTAGTARARPGRLNWERIAASLDGPPTEVDEWFVCGPPPLVEALGAALADRGVDEDVVHHEQFVAGPGDGISLDALPDLEAEVTLLLDGIASTHTVAAHGPAVLPATLPERGELPFACRDGVCGTCRAKVQEGAAVMERCSALTRRDRAAGYVLACVAHPVTERLVLDFDA